MQNYEMIHSSRVKFVYPSDEEMGDLTFIVAERKTSASSSWTSCNILLYLLVFQVRPPRGAAPEGFLLVFHDFCTPVQAPLSCCS